MYYNRTTKFGPIWIIIYYNVYSWTKNNRKANSTLRVVRVLIIILIDLGSILTALWLKYYPLALVLLLLLLLCCYKYYYYYVYIIIYNIRRTRKHCEYTTGMNNAYDFNSVSHPRSRGWLFTQMLCLCVRIIIIILWWNDDEDDGGGVSIRKIMWWWWWWCINYVASREPLKKTAG